MLGNTSFIFQNSSYKEFETKRTKFKVTCELLTPIASWLVPSYAEMSYKQRCFESFETLRLVPETGWSVQRT